MSAPKRKSVAVGVLSALLTLLLACQQEVAQTTSSTISVAQALGGDVDVGFARALAEREFTFPADHGSHPEFRNEWWYFTGHLQDEDRNTFGFQATFFRIGLMAELVERPSAWATKQLWMAHAAITDVAADRHLETQRLSRGNPGMAGIQDQPLQLWIDNWTLHANPANGGFPWQLSVRSEEFSFDLQLDQHKPIVLNGENGLSRKSANPGNASYYYSVSRLASQGTLISDGQQRRVSGTAWLDREWSTSALDDDQQGWDWFSLQFDSGDDLMFYQLRRKNGEPHPFSSGTWNSSAGKSQRLDASKIHCQVMEYWQASDGRRYPVRWRVRYADIAGDWIIQAAVNDQVMNTLVVYWEGLVNIIDTASGQRVGHGYLEMTGY